MQNAAFSLFFILLGTVLTGQNTFHKLYDHNSQFFYSNAITPLSNGDLLLCNAADNTANASVIALTNQGQLRWHKKYQPLLSYYELLESGNDFVALGYGKNPAGQASSAYGALVNLAADGSFISGKKIQYGPDYTTISGLINAPNGHILSGFSIKNAGSLYLGVAIITRVDTAGQLLWSKSYVSGYDFNDFQARLIVGNTIYACGNIRGNACLVRIDLNTGDLIGVTALGGPFLEEFTSIASTPDGNLLLAGTTRSSTPEENSRPWVVKMSPVGQIIWSKTYNLPGLESDCFLAKSEAGYFVLSISAHFVAIDENGVQLWAKNYAGGQTFEFEEVHSAPDGGFFSYSRLTTVTQTVLKTDAIGNVVNGCCPAPVIFEVSSFNPPLFNYPLTVTDFALSFEPLNITVESENLNLTDYCQLPVTSLDFQIPLCTNDSVEINGVYYTAPNTIRDTISSLDGPCDTVKVYHLTKAFEPFIVKNIKFCPGLSVNINGTEYTQPGTVTEMIPASSGCDTLLAYILQYAPLPVRKDSAYFCQGDTAWIDGNPYFFPDIITDTIPGSGNDCDTLLKHVLFWLNYSPSTVSINCPADILVNSGSAAIVNYPAVSASSDCVCPNISLSLEQGLPSGALFPPGNTNVCYTAYDACYNSASCCFSVKIEEENACDVKENGCLKFELLSISLDQDQNRRYRLRVTNTCSSPMLYAAFELPGSSASVEPAQGMPYTSAYGNVYEIRTPNHAPFRSIRFKSVAIGIANGASDVFEYSLPAQVNPSFIHVAASLGSNNLYQTILNTFGCSVQAANRSALALGNMDPALPFQLFPNPSEGTLFISLPNSLEQETYISIRNAQGKLILNRTLAPGDNLQEINLPAYMPNGFYWLNLNGGKADSQAGKFILLR